MQNNSANQTIHSLLKINCRSKVKLVYRPIIIQCLLNSNLFVLFEENPIKRKLYRVHYTCLRLYVYISGGFRIFQGRKACVPEVAFKPPLGPGHSSEGLGAKSQETRMMKFPIIITLFHAI